MKTTDTPAAGKRRKLAVRFLYDEKGRRSHVLLDIRAYEKLMEELEMAEDVRACEEAIARNETPLSWENYLGFLRQQTAPEQPSTKADG